MDYEPHLVGSGQDPEITFFGLHDIIFTKTIVNGNSFLH